MALNNQLEKLTRVAFQWLSTWCREAWKGKWPEFRSYMESCAVLNGLA